MWSWWLCLIALLVFGGTRDLIDAEVTPPRIGFGSKTLASVVPTEWDGKLKYKNLSLTKCISLSTTFPNTLANQDKIFNCVNYPNLTAIIHTCSYDLMMAAHRAKVPYFIVDDGDCAEWRRYPSNVFQINMNKDIRPKVLEKLLQHYRVEQMVVVTDFKEEAVTYFPELRNEYQSVADISSDSNDSYIQSELLRARKLLRNKDEASILILTESSNVTLYHRILQQGLFSGLLRPGMKWFLPSYPKPIKNLSKFLPSGSLLVTQKVVIPGASDSQLKSQADIAALAINFIVNVYGPVGGQPLPTLQKGNYTTKQGTLAFDSSNGQVLNTMSYISVIQDRKLTESKYIWKDGILSPGNTGFKDPNDWRIGVLPNSVFYNESASGSKHGFAVDFMKEINKVNPNILHKFIFPKLSPNSTNGTQDISGSWAGLIDLLTRKEVDIVFVPVAVAGDWYETFSFASPTFGEVGVNMLMSRQNETEFQRVLWYITAPFTINVWIACAVTFILLTFVLWATDKISPNYGGEGGFGVIDSIFFISAAFMMAKLDVKPRMMSVRIFNLLLWFATLVMMASYAGSLFQYILNKPPYVPVRNFEEALGYGGSYRWFWRRTAMSWDYFSKRASQDPDSIEAKMIKMANESWPENLFEDEIDAIPKILLKETNMIAIGDTMTHLFLAMSNCQLEALGRSQGQLSTSFPMRRDWNGKPLFDKVYTALVKSTTMRQLKERYFEFNPCVETQSTKTTSIRPMDVYDVMGIFLLLGAGIVIAIIVCIIELLINKVDLSCQRLTGGGLQFGKVYNLKIVLLEPDCVWVEIPGSNRMYCVHASNLQPHQDREVTPADLGLQVGSKVRLAYYGNDPSTGERIFRHPS